MLKLFLTNNLDILYGLFSDKKIILILVTFFLLPETSSSQSFIGLGTHIHQPVKFDYCCLELFEARPLLAPSFSITYKKVWKNEKNKTFFYEAGLDISSIALYYITHDNQPNQHNFGISYNTHNGYYSFLFGAGQVFNLSKKNNLHQFTLGLESAVRVINSIGGVYFSKTFGYGFSRKHESFPLFLRLNIGYNRQIKLIKKIPAHINFYVNLSPQNLTRGFQFVNDHRNNSLRPDFEGRFYLNNSEVGIKLFTDLSKEYYKFDFQKRERKKKRKRKRKKYFRPRISIEGQLYAPPPTKFYMPLVDSFNIQGVNVTINTQSGIKAEFVNAKNNRFSGVFSLGVGTLSINENFSATASYTRNGETLEGFNAGARINTYLIPGIGFAYLHPFIKTNIQHTFMTTYVIPLQREGLESTLFEDGFPESPIATVTYDYDFWRSKLLFGLQYQPEWIINIDKPIFFGFGLVLNYSWGTAAASRVVIDNERTPYYGNSVQGFSKIGVSFRVGFNTPYIAERRTANYLLN